MKNRWLALSLFLLLADTARGQMSSISDLDREFTRAVKKVAPAVVYVEPGVSGICISSRGFILTDSFVAMNMQKQGAESVEVRFPDQKSFRARLHTTNAETHTAILAIDTKSDLPAVIPGDADSLKVGHFLMTVGNAFGTAKESPPAVTLGVVSSIRRDSDGKPTLIETSAATNPGQNGGPYFNSDGRLLGLARGLPNGQDLATVTPIDQIKRSYGDDSTLFFEKPSSQRPPRTKSNILSQAFNIAATRARKGVVTIVVERENPPTIREDVEATDEKPQEKGRGKKKGGKKDKKKTPAIPTREGPLTGTVVHEDGFVLAPASALGDDITSIEVLFHDQRKFRASVVARDRKSGLAMLLLDKKPSDIIDVIEMLDQSQIEVGQFAISVAAPHGPPAASEPFVTVGLLSAKHRRNLYLDALQTDAGINVKNAGGILVDLRGRMLGVILSPELPYGQNSGLGFAIPIDRIMAGLPRLMAGQDNTPGFIGVVLSDLPDRKGGVLVNQVNPGFPGEKAGLENGDIITRLDGKQISNREELTNFMLIHKSAGDHLKATVTRNGKIVEVVILLEPRPKS